MAGYVEPAIIPHVRILIGREASIDAKYKTPTTMKEWKVYSFKKNHLDITLFRTRLDMPSGHVNAIILSHANTIDICPVDTLLRNSPVPHPWV